jgi:hypothetical protein
MSLPEDSVEHLIHAKNNKRPLPSPETLGKDTKRLDTDLALDDNQCIPNIAKSMDTDVTSHCPCTDKHNSFEGILSAIHKQLTSIETTNQDIKKDTNAMRDEFTEIKKTMTFLTEIR